MSSPKKIIERIRKIRFGIGLDTSNLSPDQKDALKDKEKVLEDAARLAKEINTKKPRFILELIQNAEDNYYEHGVSPRVRFIIKRDELVIQNNERGFEEKNVWALCGIGETTKKNRSLGYIGEKGIGFKSVFMITDEPRIYSNGFQFKFKYEKEIPISILIPHWVEEVPNYIDQFETNIILTIRSEVRNEISEYVSQIHTTLLLFLRKLRVIEVENEILRKSEKIERRDHNGVIEIRHGTKKSYWNIVRKLVKVPDYVEEERRKDIHETEIVLAFPLRARDGSAKTTQKQHVFAFLPIRKYGFGFIIQADFLLPIGREDIIKDNDWNKWLRDSIVSVFLDAIEQFKADKKLKYTFYNYIPVKEDVDDNFFVQVVEQIYKELKSTECLLTGSNQWKKPSDVLMADDDVRKLVTSDDLQNFFNKEYLSERIKVTKAILQKLDVDEFSVDMLLECLKSHDWIEKQNIEWFARLYKYLSKQELTDEKIALLKKLSIVKLENEKLTSIDKGPIFLPLSGKRKVYGFENELRVIERDILELIEKLEKKEGSSRIKDLFKKLGISPPQPYEIIENHILPIYEDDIWKEKDANTLLGCVRYIKDNLEEYEKESDKRLNADRPSWEKKEDPLKRLKKSLLIRINKNREKWYEHPENIYISKIYENKNDLETLFRGIDVNFLHPCYIEDILRKHEEKTRTLRRKLAEKSKKWKSNHKKEIKGIGGKIGKAEKVGNEKIRKWRVFFLKLGVNDILIVKKDPETEIYQGRSWADSKVTRKRISKWEKEETRWRDCEWKDTVGCYYIGDDWKSEDFDRFVQKLELQGDIKTSLSKKLISLLDKNWNKYRKYKSCRYYHRYSGQVGWSRAETPSTFLLRLQSVAWCPTTQNTLAMPSQVFLDKSDVREVLGDSVLYIALGIESEDFVKDMGINTEANVDGVLNYLKASVERRHYEKKKFEKIYRFLNKHFEDNEDGIKEAFSNYPLIYIPKTEKKLFTSREVLWKDVSDIFGENRAYLEKHYPKLKYFFVEKLRITEKPSPKDYADVLVDLSEKGEITDKDKHLVLKIYKELNYHLNQKNVEKPISEEDWWGEFVGKQIFLTEKKEFWRNDGDVFINNHKELYDLFRDKQDIAFLLLPRGYHPEKIKFFVNATGLQYLSGAIGITPIFDEVYCAVHKDFTNQIQNLIPYIMRYLYWKENSKYEELKSNGFFDTIINLVVYTVGELQVNYTININKWKSVKAIADRKCILYQNKLYISKELGNNTDYAAIELSKIFGEIKGLDSFIISIFEKQFQGKIEGLLAVMGIEALPEPESSVLGKPPPELPKIEKIPKVVEKEVVKHPLLPEEHKLEPIEPEYVPDVTTEIVAKDWTPECPPEQAEISGEEYTPKDVPHPIVVERDKAKMRMPPESKHPVSPPETKEREVLTEKAKIEIGRWGEETALIFLKEDKMKEYPDAIVMDTDNGFVLEEDGKTVVKVIWLNKYSDQGRGHDIKLLENDTMYYIEVKSTKTEEKDWFDVSKGQWIFMREQGDKFFIYRVYGAGTRKPKVVKICNLAKLWREGGIFAYPVRIQL